ANPNQIFLYRASGRCKQRPIVFGHFSKPFSDGRARPSHIVARVSTPASRIEAGSIFSRNDIVDGSTHTGIPEGANRPLHARAPEGRSENRPALQRRFLTILNRARPGGSG